MEYVLIVAALGLLAGLAMKFGADSRQLTEREPETLGMPR
jgi:hypothetical protein